MGFRENKIFEYRISGEEKIIKIGQFYQWFNLSVKVRVLIVRPSEAQARKPYDLYLSRIVMEFQNSFFKYKLWGFSLFSFFQE